jgi:thiol reductant ABC exporter CydC subunit
MNPLWRAIPRGSHDSALALNLLLAVGTLGLLAASAYLIGRAQERPPTVLLLMVPIGLVRCLSLLKAGARYAERVQAHDVTLALLAKLKVAVFRRFLATPPVTPTRTSGDWLSALARDIDRLEGFYLNGLAPLAGLLWTAVLGGLALSVYVPVAGLLEGLALLTGGMALPALAAAVERSRGRQASVAYGEADLVARMVDLVEGLPDLAMSGLAGPVAAELEEAGTRLADAERRLDRWEAGLTAATLTLLGGATLAVICWLIPAASAGAVSPPILGGLVFLTLASLEAVAPLTTAPRAWVETARAAERSLGQEPPAEVGVGARANRTRPPSSAVVIGARDLTVRYPGRRRAALRDVSFEAAAGAHVAVIGPSGAGKSTLLAALAGLASYEGSLGLLGREVRAWDADELHRHLTVLTDRAHVFQASVLENVRLARPEATAAEIRDVLERVGLGPRLALLPNGLETWLGPGGQSFSGGELRRLQLARVLLRDTPVLLVDEPFYGLDPATRVFVSDALRLWAAYRTVVFVTHEPPGPGWEFQTVLAMDGGRVRGGLPVSSLVPAGLRLHD